MVWAYDEESGESDWKPVAQLFRNGKEANSTQDYGDGVRDWCHVTIRTEDADGKPVFDTIKSTLGHKYYLPFNTEYRSPNEQLEHAGYEELSNKWVSAQDLKVDDIVLLADIYSLTGEPKYGIVEKVNCVKYDKPETTYNFEVEGFHAYYVGEQNVCVHNANCGFEKGRSFNIEGEVGPYNKVRVDVEFAGSNRYNMHLQYKGGPGSPAKLPFDTSINKFVGTGADVFNTSSKVTREVINASKYIKGIGGVLHW